MLFEAENAAAWPIAILQLRRIARLPAKRYRSHYTSAIVREALLAQTSSVNYVLKISEVDQRVATDIQSDSDH